tara:strand:+ start:190 stop:297 length:108 start_codon:yes stop_codon:yes gene_type:complete
MYNLKNYYVNLMYHSIKLPDLYQLYKKEKSLNYEK